MTDQKTILVVDDEPDMVEWLVTFFEDNGYKTISAYDGYEGMEKAQSLKPDLITLDITMDKESGIGMYKSIHETKDTAGIPVIILTGVSTDFKRFIGSRKQVPPPAAYLEKPVNKDKLLQTVKDLLGS